MIRHNVPASELTSLKAGGPVNTVIEVGTETALVEALMAYPDAICIGGGSNLLISDEGYNGAVIRAYSAGPFELRHRNGRAHISATVDWDVLVDALVRNHLQGLESTSGVPGSVGGAVVQNLGAYGQEIADVVHSVHAWDRVDRRQVTIAAEQCEFAYRHSRFKHDTSRRFIITAVDLQMQHTSTASVRFGELSDRLGTDTQSALVDIRKAVLDIRRSKGMLLDASPPSAGSFFTNPELTHYEAQRLSGEGFTVFNRHDGVQLTSAARLIESCGFHKGHRSGNAGLSPQHVLALVNNGNAKADEIVELALEIRHAVADRFGIHLTPEPVMLGFKQNPFA